MVIMTVVTTLTRLPVLPKAPRVRVLRYCVTMLTSVSTGAGDVMAKKIAMMVQMRNAAVSSIADSTRCKRMFHLCIWCNRFTVSQYCEILVTV